MKNEAVFFDLDKTISAVATEMNVSFHLFKKGIFSLKDIFNVLKETLKYNFHITRDFHTTKENIIRLVMGGHDVAEMKKVYGEYFDRHLKKKIFPEMLEEILAHKKEARQLVIISASLDFIVEEFCRYLGIDAFYASRLEIKDNRYTGNVTEKIYMGKNKHEAVLDYAETHEVDLERSYAYGDYYEDYHMLSLVGHPVAVNPDQRLEAIATRNSWTIKSCELSASS